MTEERLIRVIGGCLDCPNRFSDSGAGYPEKRKDGSYKDVYCLADEEQRECTDNEFPIWCPLEEIDKSVW